MVLMKKKYYFFFHIETTGLPKKFEASVQDLENWPRLVQIAWILSDSKKKIISKKNYIIKPSGFSIPFDATKIHGITNSYAIVNGYPLNIILNDFIIEMQKSNYLVAHNMSLYEKIIGAELIRASYNIHLLDKRFKICTMKESINFCKIKGTIGYKWPKLPELYYKIFQSTIIESHNAEVDLETIFKCFWALRNRGKL